MESIVPIIKGVDVHHEATFLHDLKEMADYTGHTTALEAATIAQKAGVKKLILGHFSNRYADLNVFTDEARTVFPNTFLPKMLETIKSNGFQRAKRLPKREGRPIQPPQFYRARPYTNTASVFSKQDIEIAGFIAATIAWGNRKSIIKSANHIMELMGQSPLDFVLNHTDKDLDKIGTRAIHRTLTRKT